MMARSARLGYVVTKVPRWAFEKLPGSSPVLGTMMQSVGEAMAIGRTFPESLQKALRSLETGRDGLDVDAVPADLDADELAQAAAVPTPERIFVVAAALARGVSIERLHETSAIDPWFLDGIQQIVEEQARVADLDPARMSRRDWRRAKQLRFSD